MSNDTLQKVVDTTNVASGGGGLLNADQANQFIDYMWDESALMREVREVRMSSDTLDLDKIHVGRRIARKATEGVDTGENAGVSFEKISVTTTKIRLDWELTQESLEDNIEGSALSDHVAQLMATQFGNDLEDLAINGDTDHSNALLKAFDGYRKIGKARGHWIAATTPADGLRLSVFNQAIKELPRKWLARKGNLRFYTSAGLVQDFLTSSDIQGRETQIGDEIIYNSGRRLVDGAGGELNLRPYGVPVRELPLQSEGFAQGGDDPDANPSPSYGYVELTFPKNRVLGIKREVKVYRKFAEKKDTWEFTAFVRLGVQLDNEDAYVGVYDVQAQ